MGPLKFERARLFAGEIRRLRFGRLFPADGGTSTLFSVTMYEGYFLNRPNTPRGNFTPDFA